MLHIQNAEALCAVGDRESRRTALEILDETLHGLDSYHTLKRLAHVDEAGILTIGERSWDLRQKRHVYVIGAGKAANAMARAGFTGEEIVEFYFPGTRVGYYD